MTKRFFKLWHSPNVNVRYWGIFKTPFWFVLLSRHCQIVYLAIFDDFFGKVSHFMFLQFAKRSKTKPLKCCKGSHTSHNTPDSWHYCSHANSCECLNHLFIIIVLSGGFSLFLVFDIKYGLSCNLSHTTV